MGIYDRDNISYSNLLDNALKNRLEKAYRESNRIEQMAKNRGQAAKDIASTIGKGLDYYQAYKESTELEDKLKELEDKKEQAIRDNSKLEQDYYNPTSFNYQSRFNTTSTPNRSYSASNDWMVHANPNNYYEVSKFEDNGNGNPYAIPGNPNATKEEYEEYVKYMNTIYGE